MRLRVALSCAFTISAMGIFLHAPVVTPTFAQASHFCENYAHDYATLESTRKLSGGGLRLALLRELSLEALQTGVLGARRGAAIGGFDWFWSRREVREETTTISTID